MIVMMRVIFIIILQVLPELFPLARILPDSAQQCSQVSKGQEKYQALPTRSCVLRIFLRTHKQKNSKLVTSP